MEHPPTELLDKALECAGAEMRREMLAANASGMEQHLRTLEKLFQSRELVMGYVRLLLAISFHSHTIGDQKTHDAALRVAFAMLLQLEGQRLSGEKKKKK